MPTNLNALIRYKQIDTCLRNPYIDCTIERLRDVCTDALGESRGIYKRVSKRTIQEDIHVLRSSILGFNAPIVFNDGYYEYLDKDFSLFSTPISEISLLKEILKLLIVEKENIEAPVVDTLIDKISTITGDKVSEKTTTENKYSPRIVYCLRDTKTTKEESVKQQKKKEYMKWDEIFQVLNKDLKKHKRTGKFSWLFNRKRN